MSRDSAKAHYTKQPGDPDEGFITASDAQAAIDDIYDDMSAPAVIADGSVTSGKIAADAVGSAQIATGAVGSGELATDAVTSDKIADGAVSNAHVASDAAIAASKVAGTAVTQADTGTVTNGMLAGSIAKTKVAGTAITAADTGTVTGTMIAAGAVDNGNLAANAVNEAKIASGAVTTVKIADDAVTSDKIADNAVTAAQIAANAVGASELADNAVDTAAIAADAVTADKIANDTITAAELAANSVGTSELANDSVTAAKILDGTITANEIQNASITGAKLVNDTITATQIADNAVDTNAIANDAVTAAKIAADAVGSSEIAAGAVGTAEIADAAVTAAKLGSDVRIGNLLTANQAGCVSGFVSDGTITYGSGSFAVANPWTYILATVVPAVPGDTYTASAELAVTGGTSAYVTLHWRTSADAAISSVYGNTVAAGATGLSQATGVAPPTAAYALLVLYDTGATSVTVSKPGLWRGTGGTWAPPGQPILGLTDAPIGNLLSLNAASLENDVSDWAVYANCTLDRHTGWGKVGSASLRITSAAAGTASAVLSGSRRVAVNPGDVYTASAFLHSATVARAATITIQWYTSAAAWISASAGAPVTTRTDGTWTQASATATAPASAAYADMIISVAATAAAGEQHSIDALSFHRGAAGTFALPGLPVTGQSHIATNGAVHLSGTGSPEGVVTAAPGSTWLQTDATTDVKGWIRWVKATGTGNTGWVAGAEADTGRRNVAALMTANATDTVDYVYMRRIGNAVRLSMQIANSVVNTSHELFASGVIPVGFRSMNSVATGVGWRDYLSDSTDGPAGFTTSNGGQAWYAVPNGSYYYFEASWVTANAWPTSLPGSAA